jgi:hypothetical protein
MVENRFPKVIAGESARRSIGAAKRPASDVSHDSCHTAFAEDNAMFLLPLL